MIKHTPGPWFVKKEFQEYDLFIESPSLGIIAQVDEYPFSMRDEQDANAQSIAAAPEMLEALEAANDLVPTLL